MAFMPTARDIADVFESIAPIASGIAGDELGFVFGDPSAEVRGVACLWQCHARSLALAAAAGANLIITHETIFLPEQTSPWYDTPKEIAGNRLRRELLEKHKLVVYRGHSNWDALPTDGVPDQAVAAMSLARLEVVARRKFFKVHRLPKPLPVGRLAEAVSAGLGFFDIRVFGDVNQSVRQFAFLIGGFGENQWHMAQAAHELGAEALIIGEMSEFIVSAALELGMPVIETLHSISETPAIRRQAQMLAGRLPDLPVFFVPSGATGFAADVAAVRMKGSP